MHDVMVEWISILKKALRFRPLVLFMIATRKIDLDY